MAHILRMRILGERTGTILENIVESKTPVPKSMFVGTWIGKNKHEVNREIEYLASEGFVEYADQKKTKVKPTEKGLKIYSLIGELATYLDKKYGSEVMKLALEKK